MVVGMWKLNIVNDLEEITFATALKSMVYGEAQVYDKEIRMREKLYHDPDVKEVVVEEVTYRPELLYFGTLTPDPDDSRNLAHVPIIIIRLHDKACRRGRIVWGG